MEHNERIATGQESPIKLSAFLNITNHPTFSLTRQGFFCGGGGRLLLHDHEIRIELLTRDACKLYNFVLPKVNYHYS